MFELTTREKPFARYPKDAYGYDLVKLKSTLMECSKSNPPSDIWMRLLVECVHVDPNQRPEFKEIHKFLDMC